jgi:hypothetical protein
MSFVDLVAAFSNDRRDFASLQARTRSIVSQDEAEAKSTAAILHRRR